MTSRHKLKNEIYHSKTRFMQRFNKELTIKDLEEIVKGIKSGKYKFCYRQSLTRSIFEGEVKGKLTRFVYDRKRLL